MGILKLQCPECNVDVLKDEVDYRRALRLSRYGVAGYCSGRCAVIHTRMLKSIKRSALGCPQPAE